MTKTRLSKFLKSVSGGVAVLGVIAILLAVSSFIFYPKNNSPEAGQINPKSNGFMAEPTDSIDVLFVGDSEVLNSFRPREIYEEYGFTSYDCSAPGMRLPYGKTMIMRAARNQSPKVIVIETHVLYMGFSFGEAFKAEADRLIPIFEYHDRWKNLTWADFTTWPTATWIDADKGFRAADGVLAADTSQYMVPMDYEDPITPLSELYLRDIIKYCKKIGAIPVIASVPSPVNWNMARHNYMSRIAAEEGVDYIDFNLEPTKVDIDWETETRDGGDHLNLAGSEKFCREAGKILDDMYDLPDHRGDPDYLAWDQRNKVR